MSLAQLLLQWPQAVARQVYCALFLPAMDMDPQQKDLTVPPALIGLPPEQLSQALNQGDLAQWSQELDGQQVPHRIALLPRAVIHQISWNLGLLMHARELRQVVMRPDLLSLAEQGLGDQDWQWIDTFSLLAMNEPLSQEPPPLNHWATWLQSTGEQALASLALGLPTSVGQRLRWKLPLNERLPLQDAPPPDVLFAAYNRAVEDWNKDWDTCLRQIH